MSITLVVLLTVMYSWVVSMGYAEPEYMHAQETCHQNDGMNYFSGVSVNLFSHTYSSSPVLDCLQTGSTGFFIKDYTASLRSLNSMLFWKRKVVYSIFASESRLIRSRKSDLIFPFHYFW